MQDENGGGASKTLSVVAVALAVCLALVDFVVLRGEHVARVTADLDGSRPAFFTVTKTGEPHVVDIRTPRRVSGEDRGRKVEWRLVDPNGLTLREDAELLDHRQRHIRFEPAVEGEYRVYIEDNGLLLKTSSGTAHVTVTANDRRILKRFGLSL